MVKRYGKYTVLIIEDEQDILSFISRVLNLEGYRVLKAYEGNAGLEMLTSNSVDLVLLDLRLPGLDGWAVMREIKNSPELSALPIVVITAIAGAVERQRSLAMGAARHLVKPLSAHLLSRTIAAVLRKKYKHYQPAKEYSASRI